MYLLLICAVVLLYFYTTRNFNYWKIRGIPFSRPWPLTGSFPLSSLFLMSSPEEFKKRYDEHPNAKYFGIFIFHSPSLSIKDAELIKQLSVKNFDHFVDHTKLFIKPETDPLLSKNLFSLAGDRWKNMRSTLSPAFTSSKMKLLFDLISECGEQTVNFYLNKCSERATDQIDIELKDMFTRFTNDVIATSAFGIKCNSLEDRDNEFYKMGEHAAAFSSTRLLLSSFLPFIMKHFGGIVPSHVQSFFTSIIMDTLRTREKHNIVRPDMIHLLMEAQKGKLNHESNKHNNNDSFSAVTESEIGMNTSNNIILSDEDITAQALIFFIAGFETVASLLSFTGYELAVNPDIQMKLQTEIDETLESCNGKITYEAILKMKYLDLVVAEALRKWPPILNTDRICTKDYTLRTEEGIVNLKKGDAISFPIYPIHHDEKYYSHPERFDPERFNDENKKKIHPFSYLPFGVGPRACIGSRFALMESKIVLFYLLTHFEFVATKKTEIPLKLSFATFRFAAANGIWVGLKKRQS